MGVLFEIGLPVSYSDSDMYHTDLQDGKSTKLKVNIPDKKIKLIPPVVTNNQERHPPQDENERQSQIVVERPQIFIPMDRYMYQDR